MDRTILITGGNSDIGVSVIDKIRENTEFRIISTRCNGASVSDKVDKEYKVDFENEEKLIIDEILKNEKITDLLVLHGYSDKNDKLEQFRVNNNIIEINLNSAIYLTNKCLPGMKKNGFGRIIFTGTASAEHGGGSSSFNYGLAKSGLVYLTKHLAKYYSSSDILINMISPGFVDTKFHQKVKNKNDIIKRADSIPLKRAAKVNEVADLVLFMLLKNNYINGENIVIDGGDFI